MRHHPFTLRQLQYLVAVAELLSFRKAAARCRVSQPSLSAQIAEVEAALGVAVFERSSRRVLVTPTGAALILQARQALREADALLALAERSRDPLSGTLRLGVIPTISPYLLPTAAPALRLAFPRLTAVWVEGQTASLLRQLAEGEIEAAVLALEAPLGEVEVAELGRDPFSLAAPTGHPLALGQGPVDPAVLLGETVLLLDDGHCLREQALEVCSRGGAVEQGFRATSLSTLVAMVAAGLGLTLLPRLALEAEAARADLVIRPFTDPAPYRTLALAWRPASPLAASYRALAGALATTVAAKTSPESWRSSAQTVVQAP